MRETPYWWEDAPVEASRSATALPPRADVAILGAGYTGLSAARSLARAGASVVVLERETIGWGASSRNGGQVLTGLKLSASDLLARFGRERAQVMFAASLAAIDHVEQLVAEEAIDCGFRRTGHLDAAFKPAHFERFRREQEVLARDFGHEVRLIARAEQPGELGSDFYHGLMLDPKSAALHPARYVRGLGAAAWRAGADVQERTEATRIVRDRGGFRVDTPRGEVVAKDVLVATNGYTGAVTRALRRRVIPIGSYIIATAPLSSARVDRMLPRRRVVFDSKNFLFYFRITDDRRLLFGGRAQFTPSTTASTRESAAILRRGMLQVFPELSDVATDYAWSGNVCFTPDLLPRAGRLHGLHFAMGYAGHGVAMATWLGDVVADLMLGRADRNPLAGLAFRAIPAYEGRPWFLPLAGLWYKLRDWAT
jgi:glycine/D-amino acid oxidase-like deaminating enzyme